MSSTDDAGKLVLRLTVGILVLMHGIAKLVNGIGPIEGMLVARGMPAFFAWGAYIGEVLAPLLLIIGIYTRAAAGIVAVHMIVAIALAHSAELLQLNKMGGWALELQGMFLFGALAIVLLGAGRYSVAGKTGVMN